ncbi:hypothetical protein AB832_02345 [Flavobacteriaceae bacterium (ex Bugula neritina AB1)]|nr:hypothetical protein AB832_02345 [Flavobacteriaceae bacterium (ex Bugula neritina AB1)]
MKTNSKTIALPNCSKNVNHNVIRVLTISLFIILLMSCSKNDDNDIIIDQILNGQELAAAIIENREEAIQTSDINSTSYSEVYGSEGTILGIPANSFTDQDGNLVTGSVTIQLIEIYDKAKMLLTKMPTNGKNSDGDIATLVSGGEFYINATQNNEQLQLVNGISLFAPADNFDTEMILFSGEDNDCNGDELTCDIVWEENEENGELEIIQREGPDGAGVTGYGGFISNFGWTNIDRWYNDPRPKTMLYVDVPEGYDNTNCNVYVSYDGEPTALALLDIYDPETGLFSEHYGQIPIGLEVHFIFVSVQDGDYVYAIQGATITEDHVEVISTTNSGTEAALIDLINALP